jgi:type II secretory pathway pseudopilin PulG
MLHLLIHKINRQNLAQGYTLVEILAIIAIVGIMCAIATPSLLAMQGVAKLNSSADNIRTALETSQFQAIKKKTICDVSIPNGSQILQNCFNTFNLDSGITVATSGLGTTPQVTYNRDGLTRQGGTIIVSSTDTGDKRCLVVNQGVGLIRGGKYISSTCQVTE